jgi:phosphate/sulfate permease
VANSFATSVGAGVLTIRQVKYIAGFFEFFGAFLMGSRVSKTIRKGIVQLSLFKSNPGALMLGMVCANISAGIWLQIATYFKLPVSTTHSIVGSIIGFALVLEAMMLSIGDGLSLKVFPRLLSLGSPLHLLRHLLLMFYMLF